MRCPEFYLCSCEPHYIAADILSHVGAVIRGVLVPMEDSSTTQRKRRRAAKGEYTCCMVEVD